MKRNFLNTREKMACIKYLDDNTAPDGDGFVKYVNGVANDEDAAKRMTQALGFEVTTPNVVRLRQDVCGKLRKGGASPEQMAKVRAKAKAKLAAKRRPIAAIAAEAKPAADDPVASILGSVIHGAINDLRAEINALRLELRVAMSPTRDIPKFVRKNGGNLHAAE
jgi:hypothetical protein